jgi:hypothetical protein
MIVGREEISDTGAEASWEMVTEKRDGKMEENKVFLGELKESLCFLVLAKQKLH